MNIIVKTIGQAALLSCLLFSALKANAEVDLFLQIDGIEGESLDEDYPGSMDILSWSEGLAIPVQIDIGGGGSAGKASAQSISITKLIDRASPGLRFSLARGELLPTASIIVRKSISDNRYEMFRIDLTDVRLETVSASASSGGDRPIESLSLFFTKIRWTYTPADPTGKTGAKIIRGWDFSKNAAY